MVKIKNEKTKKAVISTFQKDIARQKRKTGGTHPTSNQKRRKNIAQKKAQSLKKGLEKFKKTGETGQGRLDRAKNILRADREERRREAQGRDPDANKQQPPRGSLSRFAQERSQAIKETRKEQERLSREYQQTRDQTRRNAILDRLRQSREREQALTRASMDGASQPNNFSTTSQMLQTNRVERPTIVRQARPDINNTGTSRISISDPTRPGSLLASGVDTISRRRMLTVPGITQPGGLTARGLLPLRTQPLNQIMTEEGVKESPLLERVRREQGVTSVDPTTQDKQRRIALKQPDKALALRRIELAILERKERNTNMFTLSGIEQKQKLRRRILDKRRQIQRILDERRAKNISKQFDTARRFVSEGGLSGRQPSTNQAQDNAQQDVRPDAITALTNTFSGVFHSTKEKSEIFKRVERDQGLGARTQIVPTTFATRDVPLAALDIAEPVSARPKQTIKELAVVGGGLTALTLVNPAAGATAGAGLITANIGSGLVQGESPGRVIAREGIMLAAGAGAAKTAGLGGARLTRFRNNRLLRTPKPDPNFKFEAPAKRNRFITFQDRQKIQQTILDNPNLLEQSNVLETIPIKGKGQPGFSVLEGGQPADRVSLAFASERQTQLRPKNVPDEISMLEQAEADILAKRIAKRTSERTSTTKKRVTIEDELLPGATLIRDTEISITRPAKNLKDFGIEQPVSALDKAKLTIPKIIGEQKGKQLSMDEASRKFLPELFVKVEKRTTKPKPSTKRVSIDDLIAGEETPKKTTRQPSSKRSTSTNEGLIQLQETKKATKAFKKTSVQKETVKQRRERIRRMREEQAETDIQQFFESETKTPLTQRPRTQQLLRMSTKPVSITGSMSATRLINRPQKQTMITKSAPKTITLPKTKPAVLTITKTKTTPAQDIKRVTTTITPTPNITPGLRMSTPGTPPFKPSFRTRPPKTRTTPRMPRFGFGKDKKQEKQNGKLTKGKFTPSLTAVVLNIRGKKPKKLTGLGIRPLGKPKRIPGLTSVLSIKK